MIPPLPHRTHTTSFHTTTPFVVLDNTLEVCVHSDPFGPVLVRYPLLRRPAPSDTAHGIEHFSLHRDVRNEGEFHVHEIATSKAR